MKAKAYLVLLLILASPVVAFAAGNEAEDTIWDWIVRLVMWASGGWHGY